MTDQMQTEPESYIQIIFSEPGSVVFTPIVKATPLQLFAVAEYLRIMGESMFMQQMMKQQQQAEMNKIAVPGKNFEGDFK